MSTYSFYKLSDGTFTGMIADIPPHTLGRHLRSGIGAKEGRFDSQRQRVDLATDRVVKYVPPPPPDTEWVMHELVNGAWVARPTLAAQWRTVRERRDRLLAETDWRVVAAAERGDPVPESWRAYRQALRDVPLQGDPTGIAWPDPPT